MPRTKLLPLAVLASSLACTPPAGAPSLALTAVVAPHASQPVVVTLVVDQLAAWVARERLVELPPDGGFARLRREGTWVVSMRYEHAVTDTAPGHSALYTGAAPTVSGIFANEVLTPDGKPESILRDAESHLVTSDGVQPRASSSLAALRSETLADRLRTEHPDAVILSLSLKDRGALFAGGHHPTASVWFDTTDNRFVTSTAVANALPTWAIAGLTSALAKAEASTWTPLDAAWIERHAATPDAQPGEGDLPGFGVVFPHLLAGAKRPSLAFRTSPFADEVLLDLAVSALDAEGGGKHTTLLAVSLSANDYIGHTFGPDSWEAWDEIARLDRTLARFFSALDARFGPDGYSVLLTGDHGTNPMPEVGRHRFCDGPGADPWKRACDAAHRVLPGELSASLYASANAALGAGDWVIGVSDPYVYLSAGARALDPTRRAKLDAALRATLLAYPGVVSAYPIASVPTACPPFADESIEALVCRSVAPAVRERGAEFYLVLGPGSFFDPTVIVGKGTSHGSPYLYDRTVPLLVRAPGRVAAGRVVDMATFNAFVDTAASLLGVSPPHDAVTGGSITLP